MPDWTIDPGEHALAADEDLFGLDELEAVTGAEVKLDYAAGSIGVDLKDV